MKNLKLALAALSLAAISGAAFAHSLTGTVGDYGRIAAAGSADRQIAVTAATHSINVTDGETIEFTNGTDSVTWHFETYPGQTVVDLSALAPKLNTQGVRVYVQGNPLYQ